MIFFIIFFVIGLRRWAAMDVGSHVQWIGREIGRRGMRPRVAVDARRRPSLISVDRAFIMDALMKEMVKSMVTTTIIYFDENYSTTTFTQKYKID